MAPAKWLAALNGAAPTLPGSKLRSKGDKLRNEGDYAGAARHYAEHLVESPSDYPIWVQLGHARKEIGDLDGALVAYEQARELNGSDPDLYLNIGHLKKLTLNRAEAIIAYRKAVEIDANCTDALRELVALGAAPADQLQALAASAQKTIYLDMTDLMEYVKHNPSLSGIQRVVSNLIKHSLDYSVNSGIGIMLVVPEYDRQNIFSVNRNLVMAMLHELEQNSGDRAALNKLIEAVYASRKPVTPKEGDVFTIAGAFWIYAHYDMVRRLRARGVKFVVFIHDLIQLSHPEYVHAAATSTFRRALVDVTDLADGVLTNSEFVARDVENFLQQRTNISIPAVPVPLATELQPPIEHMTSDVVTEVLLEPYVLSVSTIEVRKNHMYMIKVWEKLRREGVGNIPNLVFVGKLGWDVDPFLSYIESSDMLGGRLKILHGVSDADLAVLYKNAKFTMFTSFVEGFGLPVGESLAHGVPCISSSRSSMPEVGGAFAKYVDPDDVEGGYRLVKQLLEDDSQLVAWRKQIAEGYHVKTWESFATEYFDKAIAFNRDTASLYNTIFAPGKIYGMGRSALAIIDDSADELQYLANCRATGWHDVEDWGSWASARRAILKIQTNLSPNSEVKVLLDLHLPHGSDPSMVTVKIDIGGKVSIARKLGDAAGWNMVAGTVGSSGIIELALISIGPFAKPDNRDLYVGLSAIGFYAATDTSARLELLERLLLR